MIPTQPAAGPLSTDHLLTLSVWEDPLVEALGHEPLSRYVEMCWTPVLGPTSILVFRRLGTMARTGMDGAVIDLVDLAVGLGVGEGTGTNSVIRRSLARLVNFDVARWDDPGNLAVRRALWPLPERMARRLGLSARRYHDAYAHTCPD